MNLALSLISRAELPSWTVIFHAKKVGDFEEILE
jgi:hypothetical protein